MSLPKFIHLSVAAICLAAVACTDSSLPNSNPASRTYSGALTATIFNTGENRFPFTIFAVDGLPLYDAHVLVTFSNTESNEQYQRVATNYKISNVSPHYHRDGTLHIHDDNTTLYVVDKAVFQKPGMWIASLTVMADPDITLEIPDMAFMVTENSDLPATGEPAPSSNNPTLDTVDDASEISTRTPPAKMHDLSIADALGENRPIAIIFATPSFCVSRQCGPVLETAVALQSLHGEDVIFIHIEPYELTPARTEGNLVPSHTALAWSLPSEPWTYVIGKDGIIVARYEGIVSYDELNQSIIQALESS